MAVTIGLTAQSPNKAVDDKLIADYVAQWAKGDAKALAAMYDTEALSVASDGVSAGRAAIEKRFADNFAGPWKGTRITMTPGAERQLSADVRIAEGTYTVDGVKDPSGKPAAVKGRYANTMVRRGGTWLIASNAAVEMAPAPATR